MSQLIKGRGWYVFFDRIHAVISWAFYLYTKKHCMINICRKILPALAEAIFPLA